VRRPVKRLDDPAVDRHNLIEGYAYQVRTNVHWMAPEGYGRAGAMNVWVAT
jgi:hypothetical protein